MDEEQKPHVSIRQCEGVTSKDARCKRILATTTPPNEIYCPQHKDCPNNGREARTQRKLLDLEQKRNHQIWFRHKALSTIKDLFPRFELVAKKLALTSFVEKSIEEALDEIKQEPKEELICSQCQFRCVYYRFSEVVIPHLGICISCFTNCNDLLIKTKQSNEKIRKRLKRKQQIQEKIKIVQEITELPDDIMKNILLPYWIES
jgi:hypothetical protein